MAQHTAPALEGRTAIIAGGTGSVGEGIVRAWLESGARVAVPTRSQDRADEFRRVIGDAPGADRLALIVGDYTTYESAQALADRVEAEHGPVTDAVASIGSWWAGSAVWDTSQAAWNEYFTGYATAHLAMARTFVPRLQGEGAYHVIVGGSALFPIPGSGIVSMQQAALLMMAKVFQAETQGQRRVFTELLGPVNSRNRPGHNRQFVDNTDVGLLTTILSANPAAASANFELLDSAALTRVLDEVNPGGEHR